MEPSLIVAAYGPVHIVVYERDPDIVSIDKAATYQRRLHGEVQRPVSLLTVVKAGLNMPKSEVRQHSAELMRANASWTNCAAIVAPQVGLWTSAAMSVVAGLNVLSRASIPLRLFTDAGKAAAWTLASGELESGWVQDLAAKITDLA